MSVDLAAFLVNPDGSVTQALADATVSGPARLLQRVADELLTEQDSVPYLPGRGSPFLAYLRGRAATETDVFAAFAASAAGLRKNLQADETDADPDDERFLSARATGVVIGAGRVALKVLVTNRAGQPQRLTVPLEMPL